MEDFTTVIEALILICTALGGFREAILKPYFSHRDKEREWKEKYDQVIEERENEREERQKERAKMLGDKYDQLVQSISNLSTLVNRLGAEQQQMALDEARFHERFESVERRLDDIQKRVDSYNQ